MSKIKTRSELFREFARVIDLCSGTNVDPFTHGVSYLGSYARNPYFPSDSDGYTFMISIVEDKPVFVGDYLWDENTHFKIVDKPDETMVLCRAIKDFYMNISDLPKLSWNPPKPDQYAHLIQAQMNGKYLAFLDQYDVWNRQKSLFTEEQIKNWPVDRWRIAEDDIIIDYANVYKFDGIPKTVKIKLTKSGITGKITAEVIE